MRKPSIFVIIAGIVCLGGVGCQVWRLKGEGSGSRGEALFSKHCERCHGAVGDAGALGDPAAAPFDGNAELGGQSDEHLFAVIKHGGDANKRSAQMHAFGAELSDRQIRELVSYLRRKVEKP